MSIVTCRLLEGQYPSGIYDAEDVRYGDIGPYLVAGMRTMLESMAESEMEARVGCKLHERSDARADHRNGYRDRVVQTPYTTMTIKVPRLRNQGFVPSFLRPGNRATAEVEQWVAKGFLCGLSRGEIISYMQATCGARPSEDVLRRVQVELDRQAKAFKTRPLQRKYAYLFLDAAWVKDIVGPHAVRVCVLTALGVTPDGEKEILGFERVKRENTLSWIGFLSRLVERGLDRNTLCLVISDEHEGLKAAVPHVLGDVAHQLCWAHRVRNVVDAVKKADRAAVLRDIKAIYCANDRRSAAKAAQVFLARWRLCYPSVVQSVQEDLGYLLAFLDCPELHRKYVRTTNPIERVFRDLRRRRYGCGAFANTLACDRVLYSVYRLLNERWSGQSIWEKRRRQGNKPVPVTPITRAAQAA